jgi:MFS family permease
MKIHYHQRNKSDDNNNINSNSNNSNNALIHNATFLLLFFLSLAQTSVLLVTLLPVVNAVSSSSLSLSSLSAAAGAGAGAGTTSPKSFATMTKKKKTPAFASIKKTIISNKKEKVSSTATATATTTATSRGGGGIIATGNKVNYRKETLSSSSNANKPQQQEQPPSIYWAVLHNWLYFLSLGFNAINMPYLIRQVIDGTDAISVQGYIPSSNAIALSGNVEAIDKVCTFCGIAFLSALSDKYGRKSLIVWSSFGFAITNLLQAFVASSSLFFLSSGSGGGHGHGQSSSSTGIRISLLYLADFIDGCSSCMTPVCQAYVADCSYGSSNLASNLGIFQGYVIKKGVGYISSRCFFVRSLYY